MEWLALIGDGLKTACDALAPFPKNIDSYLASGQLELLSHPSWYLESMGRLKSFDEISGALLHKQDQALAKGFKFLRAAGDAGGFGNRAEQRF